MLKGAAASGVGLIVGDSVLASPGGDMTIESVALPAAKDEWFAIETGQTSLTDHGRWQYSEGSHLR